MEVGATVGMGAVVEVEIAGGGRVGRVCVGADSVNAGWQAETNKEAMIVIHSNFFITQL